MDNKQEIITGIASYQHYQDELLALIKDEGVLTADKFDEVYSMRNVLSKPGRVSAATPQTFMLGGPMGMQGGWAFMLDLLQQMAHIDLVIINTNQGKILYSLP